MKQWLSKLSKVQNVDSVLLLLMILSFILWMAGKNLEFPRLATAAAYFSLGLLAFAAGTIFEKVAHIEQMLTEIKGHVQK